MDPLTLDLFTTFAALVGVVLSGIGAIAVLPWGLLDATAHPARASAAAVGLVPACTIIASPAASPGP